MSETAPVAAPTAAPATPAAPSTPHHSALQPRAPQGTFTGPPDPTKAPPAAPETPPPPKSWRLGDREVTNPDDLYTEALAAKAEREATAEYYRKANEAEKRLKELEAKLANPRALLTPEQEHALMMERAKQWQEEEYIKSLPPEQQAIIRAKQEIAREREQLNAEKSERDRLKKEAEDAKAQEAEKARELAMIDEFKTMVDTALDSAGLPKTNANKRHVAEVIEGGVVKGVIYPPEVIGARVRARVQAERRATYEEASVDDLISEGNLKKLAAIEDPAVLRKLAAVLGDKLRRINLAELGLTPTVVPKPTTGSVATGEPDLPPGHPDWEKVLRARLKR